MPNMIRKPTRLPTKKECIDEHGNLDVIRYMGYSLFTGCPDCDGTGYLANGITPVFGDVVDPAAVIDCCPNCNPHGIKPRDLCSHCSARGNWALGKLYVGKYYDLARDRIMPLHRYLCEAHARFIEEDGFTLTSKS